MYILSENLVFMLLKLYYYIELIDYIDINYYVIIFITLLY